MRFRPARILCATDFSDPVSSLALSYAAELARKFAGKVFLCHVTDLSPASIHESPRLVLGAMEEIRRKADAQIRTSMSGKDVDWEPVLLEGDPSSRLVQIAAELKADLVIVATHARSGLQRLIWGSVTHELLHTLDRPLLVVREHGRQALDASRNHLKLEKIVAACDFSADARLAMDYASSLAQEFQAELCLFHALEPVAYHDLTSRTKTLSMDLEKALHTAIEERLSALVDSETKTWAKVRHAISAGKPPAEIVAFAEAEQADLIVVGSRGIGPVSRLLLGSTAERVVGLASCPVLVVREPGCRREK
jgi:nucleotide-binding universal stress UspA family protein